tara:strand:+ start:3177 stop:4148 length:972 start_codon:yes stop_codon:yes gene_type:complete
MKILVTGGAGYIGSHISLNLLDQGHEVTVIDNLSTGNISLVSNKAEFIKCEISDEKKIESILKQKKYDALIHCAAFIQVEESINHPEKYYNNNTMKSKKLFDVCIKNGLSNIIFSSTAAVYGNPKNNNLISEMNKINPINPYGQSKAETENYLIELNSKKINFIILRYFNVAGADLKMRSGLISKKSTHLIKILSEVVAGKREKITIFGDNYNTPDGTAIRDYIHVSDLADIHTKVLEFLIKTKKSEIFNCGYGVGFSVKEVLDMANKIYNNKIKIDIGERRAGDAQMLVSDVSKLRQMIDWQPKYNKLNTIIQSSIDWEKKL